MFRTYCGGSFENQWRAMARLRVVLPLSVLLMGVLLHTSLQSWTLSLIILLNLPFAAIGQRERRSGPEAAPHARTL